MTARFVRGWMLVLSGAAGASAAPTVGTPVATPASIPANTAAPVAVTVQIADPSLIPGSVNLLQVDGTGKTVATLGVMQPGTGGSFARQVTLNQAAPGEIFLKVTAAFKGLLQRVSSNIIGVGVVGQPAISGFSPASGGVGTLVTLLGSNLVAPSGAAPAVNLGMTGGGTIAAKLLSFNGSSLVFAIPHGAVTGPISVSVAGQTAASATPFTVTPGTIFAITASPRAISVIQGQSAAIAVSMTSASGFSGLAQLSVMGLPQGITAVFQPPSLTPGQTSVLTLTAPAAQSLGSGAITIVASPTVDGIPLLPAASAQLTVQAPTMSLLGRTVVSDSMETPLAGVTVTMLGQDGNKTSTGCTGSTVSDGAGNFVLANLSAMCVGPQLVAFDGTTATAPPGKYAAVNLAFTFSSGQVTTCQIVPPPAGCQVLAHLPRIDNQETFNVQQNSSADQTYSYTSIPGLTVTVYAGTTLTMPDGSKPNPFPLVAVEVPVDRLPDTKPNAPTMLRPFIVAFQPANVTASQPVAVTFPNVLNSPPGQDMPLMTLDPTQGRMVPYGTGTVSPNGAQIVPDVDPEHAPHLFGIVHFDWHGPMPPTPPTNNPPPTCQCPPGATCFCPVNAGKPVDASSGLVVIKATDISINGPRGSISIDRTLRTMSSNPGPFGIGSGFNYSYQLGTFAFIQGQGLITLVMPDGNQFPLIVQPDGTLINTTIPTLRGAVMTASGGSYFLRWKNGTVYQFNTTSAGGREAFLTAITDSNGNAITLTLNPSVPGQVTKITDPVGRSLTLSYDGSNRITLVTDPIGRTVQYDYTSAGYLSTVTDPMNGVTTYGYNGQNQLVSEQDARKITIAQNTYDSAGRVIAQQQADGGIIQFFYTLLNPTVPNSPLIGTTVVDPLHNPTSYRFTPGQLLTDATDPSGQTTSYTLDPTHSNLVTATAGTAVCSTCGNPSQGNQTFTLDANGNIASITDALGNVTAYVYEPVFNKVKSITDPLGNQTQFVYDLAGNLTRREDPNHNVTAFVYNSAGQVTQITDATGKTTSFVYDQSGNLSTVTDALKNTTTTVYDAISRPTQTIDALGRRTETAYDALSRVKSQTNAQNQTTSFGYDAVGNLVSVTDARGNKTSFTYDGMNRLLTRTTQLGTADSRTYDFNGNLTQFVDRRGQTSSFKYDTLNRLIGETYPDSTVSRSYDANSRLTQVTDSASGVFQFTYDLDGRLTGSTNPVGQISYSYDTASRMMSHQVAGQPPLTYGYDSASNLTGASLPGAGIAWAYDPRNLIDGASRTNGVSSLYGYDADQRLLTLTHSGPAGVLNSQAYTYDATGNRASATTNAAQPLVTQAVTGAAYDGNNQQNQFGAVSNTFDANGNLTSSTGPSGATAYTWDSRNRLVAISAPSGQTTKFVYDFGGNLIQQMDSGPVEDLVQKFQLDDLTNVAFVSRSDGDQYAVLAGRSLDQHVAVLDMGGAIEYGLSDAINSTALAVDQNGTVKSGFFYEPFGQTTTAGTYPFQFTGRVPAPAGLYFYRARYYNAPSERFISEDPVGSDRAADLYVYANDDPVSGSDPLGLQASLGPVLKPAGKCLWDAEVCLTWSATLAKLGSWKACRDLVADCRSYCNALRELHTCMLDHSRLRKDGFIDCFYQCGNGGRIAFPASGQCPATADQSLGTVVGAAP